MGTVSGSTITFGTPVVFYSALTRNIGNTFDVAAGKIVVGYRGPSNYGYGIVGTVSGTSISFGSPVGFSANRVITYSTRLVYEPVAQKIVLVYTDQGNANYGSYVVGTVSGTAISFGGVGSYNNGDTQGTYIVYDSVSGNVVVAYTNGASGSYGTARVGTVSGTSITWGTAVAYASISQQSFTLAYDSTAKKVAVSYHYYSGSSKSEAIVGTVSGTSISFGAVFDLGSANIDYNSTYDPVANKIVLVARDYNTTNYGVVKLGTISGTSISFGAKITFSNNVTTSGAIGCFYDPDAGKTIIAYTAGGSGLSVVWTTGHTATNNTDFIGITAAAIANGATGPVNVYGGINEAQTGLTIGSDYYVQANGSLSTTASSVKVGQAISATTINMMDLT